MSTRCTSANRVNQFIKDLERLDRSRTVGDKFRDLIGLCYCAFAKRTALSAERADRLETRYMGIVARYEDKDAIRAYPELLAQAIDAVYSERTDFLGRVSSELGVLSPDQGQFFTPYQLALALARISVDGVAETIREKGYFTVQEPAAGAGGLLLAVAQVLEEAQFDPATSMLAHAVDDNSLAYQMCFLQLTWRGIPALVQFGNSLSREVRESAWTDAAFTFFAKHGHLFDYAEKHTEPEDRRVPLLEAPVPKVPTPTSVQLALPQAATQPGESDVPVLALQPEPLGVGSS